MSFTAINSVAGGAKKDTGRGGGKETKGSDKMIVKDQVKELSAEEEREREREKDRLEKEAYIAFLAGKYGEYPSPQFVLFVLSDWCLN